jgi:SsrA-binding protein
MADKGALLAENRKARFQYTVESTLECGIVLQGTEVKSMRARHFSFSDAYAEISKGELWLMSFHINPYDFGNQFNHEPLRPKKLLINKSEMEKLRKKVDEKGFTLVPTKFYLKNGRVKVEIGVAKGKKLHDKRQSIKERDVKRDLDREMKSY